MKYRIIILVLLVSVAAACFGQPTYTAAPIVAPYNVSGLAWISDDGKSGFGVGVITNPFGVQCFTYESGVISPLLTPDQICYPQAGNVGTYVFQLVSADSQNTFQLFAYKSGRSLTLPTPAGTSVYRRNGVTGVNSNGQIAVTLLCSSPGATPTSPLVQTPCAYSISNSGVYSRLQDLGGQAYATSVNANGDIAGYVAAPGTGSPTNGNVVVWSPGGGVKNISSASGMQLGIPAAINSRGQITGPGYFYDGTRPGQVAGPAYFYDGSTVSLVQMSGSSSVTPISMNDSGEIIGNYRPQADDGLDRPFYWANGTAVDLNGRVTNLPSNKYLTSVAYINNAGQILVTAVDIAQPVGVIASGTTATQYLLTPVGVSNAPSISRVINAASFEPGVTGSALITILGANLSDTTRPWASPDFVSGRLPTSLDGVSVTINGIRGYPTYVSPTQINVLAPDDTTTGSVQVQVTTSKGVSSAFTVNKTDPMPAFFTVDGRHVAATHVNGAPIGPPGLAAGANFTPAKQGETIQLFGTGFGATLPSVAPGQLLAEPLLLANQVTVLIDNKPAVVSYAGRTASGLDQLNITVPVSVLDGDFLIQATVKDVKTQANALLTIKF